MGHSEGRPDVQCVILALGSDAERLSVLLSDSPLALLPIANRPLLFYQLLAAERAGFRDVLVVTTRKSEARVQAYAEELYHDDKIVQQMRDARDAAEMMDVQTKAVEDGLNTAEALREIRASIVTDAIVLQDGLLTCDRALYALADAHRAASASATLLFLQSEVTSDSKSASRRDVENDAVCFAEDGLMTKQGNYKRVLMIQPEVEEDDVVNIPASAMFYYTRLNVRRDIFDSHATMLSPHALKILSEQKSISSLSGEFLPYLATQQLIVRAALEKGPANDGEDRSDQQGFNALQAPTRSSALQATPLDPILCIGTVLSREAFARRIDTVADLIEANRLMSNNVLPYVEISHGKGTATLGEKAHVTMDCTLGKNVRIGDSSTIKKSAVGDHTTIGAGVRVTGCIIMDHVTIADGCTISGGVIGSNANIQDKCALKDCLVAPTASVPSGSDLKGEAVARTAAELY
eukprot:Plantae.Rhodophyta-Purpureofilum_apyrenoidigerum.ctg9895.p1 GENE.Plantae.Rhodophyta-Purpureofilum_apyrenoidigerum.ctg9895~~Plantae.Rhodophyta-Purpureofilum_apyrenoidigerum.ctg9895.p1  ORF type:complete len:479 (+),score=95.78 Plantae.Rhodophyta-Purpureofilum_apyrenoidigerum.ctg9895:46-1437(+)